MNKGINRAGVNFFYISSSTLDEHCFLRQDKKTRVKAKEELE